MHYVQGCFEHTDNLQVG